MQLVIDGVTKLVQMEKKLEEKQSIENLFPNDLLITKKKVSYLNMFKSYRNQSIDLQSK